MEVKRETIIPLMQGLQMHTPSSEKRCTVRIRRSGDGAWDSSAVYRLQSLLRRITKETLEPETLVYTTVGGESLIVKGTEAIEMFCQMGAGAVPDIERKGKDVQSEPQSFEFLGAPCELSWTVSGGDATLTLGGAGAGAGAGPDTAPMKDMNWKELREKFPGAEIEVRPLLEEKPRWDRVRHLEDHYRGRVGAGEFMMTEAWMLRLMGAQGEGPTPRLTITIPSGMVDDLTTEFVSVDALREWVKDPANKGFIGMDFKEVVLRQKDAMYPLRLSVANETAMNPDQFDWDSAVLVRLMRRMSFAHKAGGYRVDLSTVYETDWQDAFPMENIQELMPVGEAELEILDGAAAAAGVSEELRMILNAVSGVGANSGGLLRRRSRYTLNNKMDVVIDCLRHGDTEEIRKILHAPVDFQVSLELTGSGTGTGGAAGAVEVLQGIAQVLRIMEKTPLMPLEAEESKKVREEYMKTVRVATGVPHAPMYFLAPKPITLEQKHLFEPGYGVVTIREGYAVTEKADGERLLVFVNSGGEVFLLNNTQQFFRTGYRLPKAMAGSLLDGEFITWDRRIPAAERDLFALFDAYIWKGKSVMKEPLMARMKLAEECHRVLHGDGAGAGAGTGALLDISVKAHRTGEDIIQICKEILEKKNHPYHVDGLIFTPLDIPVFAYYPNQSPQFEKLFYRSGRWDRLLKWKPSDQNTIDFLVKNSAMGSDPLTKKPVRYFTLFTGQRKGKYTPRSILDNLRDLHGGHGAGAGAGSGESYEEAAFRCIEHYTPGMELAKIPLNSDGKAVDLDGHPIEDQMIVEFAYDVLRKTWIPLRVRDDKTRLYRQTNTVSGTANDYEVARSIWRSMHNPVTHEMMIGKMRIGAAAVPSENEEALTQDGVYYAREVPREYSLSLQMLEFHNLVIKAHLYRAPEKRRRLLELACGKAGDMRRWEDARYDWVVGVDISRDNIVNPMNGAYSRVLAPKKYHTRTKYAFLVGDIGNSMERTPDKVFDKESLGVWQVLTGRRSATTLEMKPLEKVGKYGFDVVSCQFAIHYFWKDEATLRTFLENVSGSLTKGGVFVGTCMDGLHVDTLFEKENEQRTVEGRKEGVALWAIQRKYARPMGSPYGNKIDVYLEMTQQIIPEYLVNFEHLVELAGEYGLRLASSQLFETTLNKCVKNNEWPVKPTELMKKSLAHLAADPVLLQFSALNRWFIFEKAAGPA